ncbi:MAG: aspartate/glutamate racemase family protein [Microcella sp.]
MRTLGLLGGMSWESSIEYERIIHERVRERLGGVASADLLIRSFNFADIEELQAAGRWDDAGELLARAARSLVAAGAEAVVLCTNTMHVVADVIEQAIDVPFLHIADATGEAVSAQHLDTVGLLGTRFTMEMPFYAERLREQHGLTVFVPDAAERAFVHDVIYNELVRGIVSDASRTAYVTIVDELVARGAGGLIAGCTEIELLLRPTDIAVPLFPTARLHAEAAAAWAMGDAP